MTELLSPPTRRTDSAAPCAFRSHGNGNSFDPDTGQQPTAKVAVKTSRTRYRLGRMPKLCLFYLNALLFCIAGCVGILTFLLVLGTLTEPLPAYLSR